MISAKQKKAEQTLPSVIKRIDEKRNEDKQEADTKTRKLVSSQLWGGKKTKKRNIYR